MVVWNKQIKCDDTEFLLLSYFLTKRDSKWKEIVSWKFNFDLL